MLSAVCESALRCFEARSGSLATTRRIHCATSNFLLAPLLWTRLHRAADCVDSALKKKKKRINMNTAGKKEKQKTEVNKKRLYEWERV